ncbi:MAG: hypothetical protein K6T65_06425 [Peptococcaceae bacterium]|nr:hypothetical protein [Peptococcaceae bacterium]
MIKLTLIANRAKIKGMNEYRKHRSTHGNRGFQRPDRAYCKTTGNSIILCLILLLVSWYNYS